MLDSEAHRIAERAERDGQAGLPEGGTLGLVAGDRGNLATAAVLAKRL